MQGLEDHFGENAELDDESSAHIVGYLERYALKKGQQSRISQFLGNMPDDPPLRITELPGFIAAHADIPEQLEVERLDEASAYRGTRHEANHLCRRRNQLVCCVQ